ncbi:MAG: hypothetical protein R6U96_15005 [Promethearchaeia archaeon]
MNIFQRVKRYLQAIRPIILSHHPDCEQFKSHTIKLGSHRLCIGCFIGYPTLFSFILLIAFLDIKEYLPLLWFLGIAIAFSSTFFLSFSDITEIKSVKIAQKILMAIGAAFLFWWIWYSPVPFLVRFLYFFMIFGVLSLILNAYHIYGIHKNCQKCSYKADWEYCPGFGPLYQYLEENDLPNFLESMKKNRNIGKDTPGERNS